MIFYSSLWVTWVSNHLNGSIAISKEKNRWIIFVGRIQMMTVSQTEELMTVLIFGQAPAQFPHCRFLIGILITKTSKPDRLPDWLEIPSTLPPWSSSNTSHNDTFILKISCLLCLLDNNYDCQNQCSFEIRYRRESCVTNGLKHKIQNKANMTDLPENLWSTICKTSTILWRQCNKKSHSIRCRLP